MKPTAMRKEIVFDGTKMNDFMRGRISGIVYVLMGMPKETWGWFKREASNEWVWFVECTDDEYLDIVDTIEIAHPGVIIYNENN